MVYSHSLQLLCSVYRILQLHHHHHHHSILIRVYPCKWGWPDLPHSNSNLSNSHSPSHSIQGIFLLQTNTLAFLLCLCLPCLLWLSSRLVDTVNPRLSAVALIDFNKILVWCLQLVLGVWHLFKTSVSQGFKRESRT